MVGAKLCHSLPSCLNRFPAHALTDITKTEDQPNLGWHWLHVVLVVWPTTTDIQHLLSWNQQQQLHPVLLHVILNLEARKDMPRSSKLVLRGILLNWLSASWGIRGRRVVGRCYWAVVEEEMACERW